MKQTGAVRLRIPQAKNDVGIACRLAGVLGEETLHVGHLVT
jgi:hypothetical protein